MIYIYLAKFLTFTFTLFEFKYIFLHLHKGTIKKNSITLTLPIVNVFGKVNVSLPIIHP
jgi:hypothetical protein